MFSNSKEFCSNIKDVFGNTGQKWLSELPSLIKQWEKDFDFNVQFIMPNLTYSFVAVVKLGSGKEAILKAAPENDRLVSEMAWFNFYISSLNSRVPQLYYKDLKRGIFLMERLVPGYSAKKLVQEGKDEDATRAICHVIKNLNPLSITDHLLDSKAQSNINSFSYYSFKHVSELAENLSVLEGKVSSQILSQATRLFYDLTQDKSHDRVLHGDLHHDNILLGGVSGEREERWCAIDPHGYVGPPCFEVGAMLRNPYDCFPRQESLYKTIKKRLQILKEELLFEKEEIWGWVFAYTLLATSWSVSDHGDVPKEHLEILETLNEVRL